MSGECQDAMEYLGWAGWRTWDVCDDYGYTSETCLAYGYWWGQVADWALYMCMRYPPLVSNLLEPRKLNTTDRESIISR